MCIYIVIIYNVDGCNGQVYPLGGQLVVFCQTEVVHASAQTNCEGMGGRLLELETADKMDNFIEVLNSYSGRYVGNK